MILPARICCDCVFLVCVCVIVCERGSHNQDMDDRLTEQNGPGDGGRGGNVPFSRGRTTHQGFALSTRHTVSGIYNWD